jgi:hypothetical protein
MGRSAEERPPDRKDPPLVTRRQDGDGKANELPAQAALARKRDDHFKRVLAGTQCHMNSEASRASHLREVGFTTEHHVRRTKFPDQRTSA